MGSTAWPRAGWDFCKGSGHRAAGGTGSTVKAEVLVVLVRGRSREAAGRSDFFWELLEP